MAGALLAIPGLIWLIVHSDGDPRRVVGFSIYGASLILLYTASAVYHWFPVSPRTEDLLQRLDHMAIYGLIAGTYTPICLVTLRGAWGWSLFAVVWGIALAGAAGKLFFRHLPRWTSVGLYVGMGWITVVALPPLLQALPPGGVTWIAAGGAAYMLGALVYTIERPDPLPNVVGFHEIFHLFVLAGSALHFVFMARYVV
jgi:hemolysin III